jgi:hypothetical protein
MPSEKTGKNLALASTVVSAEGLLNRGVCVSLNSSNLKLKDSDRVI